MSRFLEGITEWQGNDIISLQGFKKLDQVWLNSLRLLVYIHINNFQLKEVLNSEGE